METVTNITTAASRAIWGEPNKDTEPAQTDGTSEEPVSGELGNTSAGEPYDKGNVQTTSSDPTSASATDAIYPDDTTAAPKSDLPGSTTSELPIRSENENDKTSIITAHDPISAISADKPISSNDTSVAEPTPSAGALPSSAAQDTNTQQGADNATSAPEVGSEEHQKILVTEEEAEEAAKVDTSGPGPKPLSEIKGHAAGPTGIDEEDGPQKKSLGEGTGEKYVKSTGLNADGGDFDASKPGAAKEADRILETKGVHHEVPGTDEAAAETSRDETPETPEKTSKLSGLKEKIKAKLHKN